MDDDAGRTRPDPGASTLRLDARALRVLAHPLRSRLLTALRLDGPATATALAAALGTNTGATSYHLRQLATVGLVEEAEAGRGRERWWRASTASHGWTERDITGDPDAEAASDWLRRSYLRTFVEASEAWLGAESGWSLEWREAADWFDAVVRTTPAQLDALQAELRTVIERHREAVPQDPDAEQVVIYVHALPLSAVRGSGR